MMKLCVKCGALIEDDTLICMYCGERQERDEVGPQEESLFTSEDKMCVHCSKIIESDSAFCPYCGKPQEVEDIKK